MKKWRSALLAATTKPITFKMHFMDPGTAPCVRDGRKSAEPVGEAADGQIRIKVMAGGSLGGERGITEPDMDDTRPCACSASMRSAP